MICPIMSKNRMMNTNGVEFISPQTTECLGTECGIWSRVNNQCGLIHEE